MKLAALFDPRGRLSRAVYGRLVVRLMLLAALLLCVAVALAARGWREGAFAAMAALSGVWLASLIQTVRRLHDRDRTGWWIALSLGLSALSFVPVEKAADAHPVPVLSYTLVTLTLSLWFLVETLGRSGTTGPNRYGPPPSSEP